MKSDLAVADSDAATLGHHRDSRPFSQPKTPMWATGDEPYYESLDLNEFPVERLRLKRCRSFRADLLHKLHIIIRAGGGYGRGGLKRTAELLGVTRITVQRWLRADTMPGGRFLLEKIDTLYSDALDLLVAEKCTRRTRRPPPGTIIRPSFLPPFRENIPIA